MRVSERERRSFWAGVRASAGVWTAAIQAAETEEMVVVVRSRVMMFPWVGGLPLQGEFAGEMAGDGGFAKGGWSRREGQWALW